MTVYLNPRQILTTVFLILLPVLAFGAAPEIDWIQAYGGASHDDGYGAVALPGGGSLLAGRTASSGAGGDDVYLVAVDEDGNIQWERTHGGAAHDVAQAVIRTDDGGFAVAGYTGIPPLDYRVLLMKFDDQGEMEWQQSYAGEGGIKGRDLVQTSDEGYLIAAERGFHLIRTNDTGVLVWERDLGTTGDRALSLDEAPSGSFLLCGYRTDGSLSPDHDARLLKINDAGSVLLDRTYDLGVQDQAHAAIELAGGDIVFCGLSGGTGSLWRITGGGAVIWREAFPAKWVSGVLQTADEGFLVAGTTYAYDNGQYQVALTRTDAAGVMLAQTEAGGAAFDLSQGLVPTAGGVVVVGSAQTPDGNGYDMLAVRFAVESASVAAVEDIPAAGLQLRNYPNPFNPGTLLGFVNPAPGNVSLKIFDSRGRHVRTLIDGQSRPEGFQEYFWDGRDGQGRALSAGVYLARIASGEFIETLRMTLVK